MHIGLAYASLLSERIAHLNDGIFYLRNEDTDNKREMENAARIIVDGLKKFDIQIDEGGVGANGADIGAYGPYTQSLRGSIYQTYARDLILR